MKKIASRPDIENRLKNSREQLAKAETDQSTANFGSVDYDEARIRRLFFSGEIGALEWVLGIEESVPRPMITGHARVLRASG